MLLYKWSVVTVLDFGTFCSLSSLSLMVQGESSFRQIETNIKKEIVAVFSMATQKSRPWTEAGLCDFVG